MMWWRSKKSPLHHQFVVLTVAYSPTPATPPTHFDLCVECIGKGIGFRGIAEHKVTPTFAQPPEHYTADNELMFGLMAEPTTGSADGPVGEN